MNIIKVKEDLLPVNSRLNSLEKSIAESKQAVVRHIAKARTLEKERNHLTSVKKALLSIATGTQDSPTNYVAMIREYDSNKNDDIAIRLQKLRTILRSEEINEKNIVLGNVMSTATRLFQPSLFGVPDKSSELTLAIKLNECLSTYDDSPFAAYLSQAPLPVKVVEDENSRCMLLSFFQRIVLSASKGFCNSNDAAILFSSTENTSLPTTSVVKFWTLLCLRLRRKILQTHLGAIVAPSLTFINKQLPSSPESHNKSKLSKKARIGDKGKTDHHSGTEKLGDREQLLRALKESKDKQTAISGQIAADLTYLCPDLSTLPKPGRAGQLFARSWALRILEKNYSHINFLALQKSFGKWIALCRRFTTDCLVQSFLRALGAKRMVQLLQFKSTKRKVRGLDVWIAYVKHQKFFEHTAAAAEIQKMIRGFLGRCKARARARARAKAKAQEELKDGNRAVLTLLDTELDQRDSFHMPTPLTDESKKSRFSSQRSPLFRFKSTNWDKDEAAVHIQCIVRGFLGRRRAIKRKERRRIRVAERAKRTHFLNARKESAVRTIQRFWRGRLGRKRVKLFRFEKARQLRRRRRAVAATTLQRVIRGGWGRTRVKALRRARAIACMQRGWRCALARRELSRRQNRHRVQIAQKAAMEKAANEAAEKKAAAERAAAQEAAEKAAKEAAELEEAEKAAAAAKAEAEKKAAEAAAIAKAQAEKEAAKRAAKEAAEREAAEKAAKAAAEREAVERAAAKEAAEREAAERAAREAASLIVSASPLRYYDLRSRYLHTQNEHFRAQAVQIQRVARGLLGRKFVRNKRRNGAVRVIQHCVRLFLLRARARREVIRRRALKRRREVAAVSLQRMGRGLIVRTGWRRQIRGDILRWFIRKVRSTIRVALAIQALRMKKRQHLRRVRAATKIQALARGIHGRKWMKKNRRRLTRERAARLKERRLKACIRIQCFFRKVLARRAVGRRRKAKEAELNEQREWEELERSLDGLHGEFMLQLMAIRMETGARGMVARKLLSKRIEAAKLEKLKQIEKHRHKSAAMIQALARGVAARARHKKNLPALKKAKLARQYCVECEVQVGMRRCRQCKDKFCVTCYEIVHAKGTRRSHTFDNLKIPANLAAALQAERERLMGGGGGANKSSSSAAAAAKRGKGKKQDWEEFFDSSAKAKYWFNKVTGEASWISPF